MEIVKKKLENGKIVKGVMSDALEEKIPFEYEEIEKVPTTNKYKHIYVCKNGKETTVYTSDFKKIFSPRGKYRFEKYLYRDTYLVSDKTGENHFIASVSIETSPSEKYQIKTQVGKIDEINEQVSSKNILYQIIKNTPEGKLKGYLNHPIFKFVYPKYTEILEMEKTARYYPIYNVGSFQCRVNTLSDKEKKIHYLLTKSPKNGQELQGVQIVGRNNLTKDFLANEYSKVVFDYDYNVVHTFKNGKEGAVFYSEHWDGAYRFYTLKNEAEILCDYDHIDFIKGTVKKDKIGTVKSIIYAIVEENGQKGLYGIDYKHISTCYDSEYCCSQAKKLTESVYDELEYVQNGIFVGEKDGIPELIFSNRYTVECYSGKDWRKVEVLPTMPERAFFSKTEMLDSSSKYFGAIITLDNGNQKILKRKARLLFESKEYKEIVKLQENQWLVTHDNGVKNVINFFDEVIVHDYTNSSYVSNNERYVRYVYDSGTKQKIVTADANAKTIIGEMDSKYMLSPIRINNIWSVQSDDELVKFLTVSNDDGSPKYSDEIVSSIINNSYAYFSTLSMKDGIALINAGLVCMENGKPTVTDLLQRVTFASDNKDDIGIKTILAGDFDITDYDEKNSRTIISINTEALNSTYGVIENTKGNICIPFNYDYIQKSENGGFDAFRGECKTEFDKYGFVVEESIVQSVSDKPHQFKKTPKS